MAKTYRQKKYPNFCEALKEDMEIRINDPDRWYREFNGVE